MKKLTLLILTLFMIAGCSDELNLTNPNEPTTDTFWQTQEDAVKGVTAVYAPFINDGGYMRMIPALTDGRGDDFIADTPWPDLWQVAQFNIPATSGPVAWVWDAHYIVIYRANQVFEYVTDMDIDPDLKERLIGQAHFLRGLAYFNLANNYYRVPIVLDLQEPSEYSVPTASVDDLWEQIHSDFREAQSRLPVSYNDVSGPDQGQIGRATVGAATGMLGKSYLYRERWNDAATEFEKLIDGGPYAVYDLVENFRDNFDVDNENNEESLFEIQFGSVEQVGGSDPNYGGEPNGNWQQRSSVAFTYSPEGYEDFLVTEWIYEEFQQEMTVDGEFDLRLQPTIMSSEYDTVVYGHDWNYPGDIYPRKYTNEGLPQPELREDSGINYRVLRFADILLMYAEAQNELGNQAAAAPYIQRVRDRAGLPDRTAEFAAFSQQQMRDQLAHERALEFAIEAQRIHDIIRWGWFDDPAKVEELRQRDSEFDSWAPGKEYLPIPQDELDVNPNLEPNSAND